MYPTLLVGSVLLLVSATGEEHVHTSGQARVPGQSHHTEVTNMN